MNNTPVSESVPLLTICIPTYNRGQRVYSLVLFLVEQIVSQHRDKVELLVVNNCSTDDTIALLTPLESKGVTLINRSVHLPSAEANMFASLEFCRGRYIWFHGDDDIPVVGTVEWLLTTIESGDVDMYIFNSMAIDINGAPTSERFLKMNSAHVDLSGDSVVFSCGFLYVLAGISTVVFRRSMAFADVAKEIANLQEIYAHVAWLLRCFARSRVRIVAQSLVSYRTDDTQRSFTHFKRYAKRKKIGDHFVWSFGLIRLLQYLLDSGTLSAGGISRIYDGRRDGTRFRLLDETVYQIYLQMKSGMFSKERRNLVSRKDFKLAREFLYRVDLFSFDTMSILEELLSMLERRPKDIFWRRKAINVCQRFERVFFAQHAENFYRPIKAGLLMGYRIYRTPSGFVALSDSAHHRRESVLSYIDPLEAYPDILTGITLEAVQARIVQVVAEQTNFASQPSNLVSAASQIADALHHIGHNIQVIGQASHTLSGLRAHEVEIQRQSTFALRLLTYRLFFGPLRHAWRWTRRKMKMA
ncbi:MAG: glycosyltransferase family 2 protein [Acidithiobacillus sp.]